MAYSLQQAMDDFFDNSGGGGISYGGTGTSGGYGAIAGGGKGAGSGSSRPYNPKDYTYHYINHAPGWNQEAHWNGQNANGERCDGWVSTYEGAPDGTSHVPYLACTPKKPIHVSWDDKHHTTDWFI
jgi:hypothetical protein